MIIKNFSALDIVENQPLKEFNTFGIDAKSRFFASIDSITELKEILATDIAKINPVLILGGGSNILFTTDYPGLIILNKIVGIEIIDETETSATVAAGGGVVWQDLVDFTLDKNLGGIENLSLIPGCLGAAPIQNIGAYGVELKDVLTSLEAIDLSSTQLSTFSNAECDFGYRDSIFKKELKDKFLITKVMLKLSKQPEINTSYGAINDVLQSKGISNPSIRDVSNAVIEIRQSKLPDPSQLGNAGSFFKNPIIDNIDFEGLKLNFPDIPGYVNGNEVKVPAAWLIEQCGWKGKRLGSIGVHEKQPLVLVNYGDGTGQEIKSLAKDIQESVAVKFGIELVPEPRII